LTEVFGQKLDPQVSRCRRLWPGDTQGFFACKLNGAIRHEALAVFASQFGAKIAFNPEFVVEKAQRYYLLNPRLKRIIQANYYYAGLYLGKVKTAFSSQLQPPQYARVRCGNKVVIDRKSAWLFICGRDLFREGITKTMGTQRKASLRWL